MLCRLVGQRHKVLVGHHIRVAVRRVAAAGAAHIAVEEVVGRTAVEGEPHIDPVEERHTAAAEVDIHLVVEGMGYEAKRRMVAVVGADTLPAVGRDYGAMRHREVAAEEDILVGHTLVAEAALVVGNPGEDIALVAVRTPLSIVSTGFSGES